MAREPRLALIFYLNPAGHTRKIGNRAVAPRAGDGEAPVDNWDIDFGTEDAEAGAQAVRTVSVDGVMDEGANAIAVGLAGDSESDGGWEFGQMF